MSSSHTVLKYTRLVHLYLGVFIAPALLFFAFTGALQIFSLHETTRGSSYKPPAWAVTLGQIHKKQTTVVPVRKLPPPDRSSNNSPEKSSDRSPDGFSNKSANKQPDKSQSAATTTPTQSPSSQPSDTPAPKPRNPLPLKIFFLLVSIGLFVSTISGIYMSYKYIRDRGLITAILIAGVVIPVLLTIL